MRVGLLEFFRPYRSQSNLNSDVRILFQGHRYRILTHFKLEIEKLKMQCANTWYT